MTKLSILFFDIETAPRLAAIWHPAQKYINYEQMVEDDFLFTWSAKWEGKQEVFSARLTRKEVLAQDDSRIMRKLADLVREADVVVAHNGDQFDLKRLNARVVFHQDEPLGPYESIDTLRLAKQNFGLPYYKLDYLAQHWNLGTKIDTDMQLWIDCYYGDVKQMKLMEDYNKHDVILLEKIFQYMRPYVRRLKRLHDAEFDGQILCPNCGTEGTELEEGGRIQNFQRRGFYRTQASTFVKLQCQNCKGYTRFRVSKKDMRSALYPL